VDKTGAFKLAIALLAGSGTFSAAAADNFGKLLTTAHEREQILQWRTHGLLDAELAEGTEASSPSRQLIRFNGMVQRSDGSTSQWVNGQWVDTTDKAQTLGVTQTPDPGKGLGVIVPDEANPDKARVIYIKPGQSFDRGAGNVMEAYRQGQPAESKTGPAADISREQPNVPGAE